MINKCFEKRRKWSFQTHSFLRIILFLCNWLRLLMYTPRTNPQFSPLWLFYESIFLLGEWKTDLQAARVAFGEVFFVIFSFIASQSPELVIVLVRFEIPFELFLYQLRCTFQQTLLIFAHVLFIFNGVLELLHLFNLVDKGVLQFFLLSCLRFISVGQILKILQQLLMVWKCIYFQLFNPLLKLVSLVFQIFNFIVFPVDNHLLKRNKMQFRTGKFCMFLLIVTDGTF